MSEEMKIEQLEQPDWGTIGGNISRYNKEQAGDDHAANLCFVLRDTDGEVIGGVIGSTYWNWMSIDLMWIQEEHRGKGYGKKLLDLAEEEGRKRGASHACLDTFTFQAPGFYEKFGYRVFGTLEDFPTGHQRFYMTKDL